MVPPKSQAAPTHRRSFLCPHLPTAMRTRPAFAQFGRIRKILRGEAEPGTRVSAGLTHRPTLLYTVVVTEPLDLGEAGESRVHLRGVLPGA